MSIIQSKRTNSGVINQDFKFTDAILVLGVFVNLVSLLVNSKNNDALGQINANLNKINENGSLDVIAQIGSNNIMEVNVDDKE
ncbi:MAG: hypothetical protein RR744_00525 [Cellulosilyticaceae bacterium]